MNRGLLPTCNTPWRMMGKVTAVTTAADGFASHQPGHRLHHLRRRFTGRGFELCKRLGAQTTPIIFLTPRLRNRPRSGLEIGADDYVAKPFSPREVSARVKAILRRQSYQSRTRHTKRSQTIQPLSFKITEPGITRPSICLVMSTNYCKLCVVTGVQSQ